MDPGIVADTPIAAMAPKNWRLLVFVTAGSGLETVPFITFLYAQKNKANLPPF